VKNGTFAIIKYMMPTPCQVLPPWDVGYLVQDVDKQQLCFGVLFDTIAGELPFLGVCT
jgi:hypothetical protein